MTQGTFYTASAIYPPLFVPGFIVLDAMGAQTGQLVSVYGAWQDSDPAPSGDGILAYVEFIAVDGSSPSSPIAVVGSPSSPPIAVPEPPTVALIFAALALVGLRRKRSGPAEAVTVRHPL